MSKKVSFEGCIEELFKKYNRLHLSRKEVAEIIGVSTKTLDRRRKEEIDIPNFFYFDNKCYFKIENVALYKIAKELKS